MLLPTVMPNTGRWPALVGEPTFAVPFCCASPALEEAGGVARLSWSLFVAVRMRRRADVDASN